ncbi:hypothetical protein ACW0JT_04560 [Arthrobacter sp. SA17]
MDSPQTLRRTTLPTPSAPTNTSDPFGLRVFGLASSKRPVSLRTVSGTADSSSRMSSGRDTAMVPPAGTTNHGSPAALRREPTANAGLEALTASSTPTAASASCAFGHIIKDVPTVGSCVRCS